MKNLRCLLAVAAMLFFFLAPATAATIPAGLVVRINSAVNFTFALNFEVANFSGRVAGIRINDSYLDVPNTTAAFVINITNFTLDVYNFTANSSEASNPTNFTAKMRDANTTYNLKVDGVFSQEITTDSYGNASWQYGSWTLASPIRFVLTTCTESWSYSGWSTCSNSQQSRSAGDANQCGTTYNRSEMSRSCTVSVAATATAAGGGGGGGGGGGSGGPGAIPEGNPPSRQDEFSFPTGNLMKISAAVLATLEPGQEITVSYPLSIPSSVPSLPGIAHSYFEITTTFNSSKYLKQAAIDFKVNKSWYEGNKILLSSITLLRYDGWSWRSLPTVRTGEEREAYVFRSNTTSFSIFAIAGTKMTAAGPVPTSTEGAIPTPTPVVKLPEPKTPTPTLESIKTHPKAVFSKFRASDLLLSFAAIVIVILFVTFRYFGMKKGNNKKQKPI